MFESGSATDVPSTESVTADDSVDADIVSGAITHSGDVAESVTTTDSVDATVLPPAIETPEPIHGAGGGNKFGRFGNFFFRHHKRVKVFEAVHARAEFDAEVIRPHHYKLDKNLVADKYKPRTLVLDKPATPQDLDLNKLEPLSPVIEESLVVRFLKGAVVWHKKDNTVAIKRLTSQEDIDEMMAVAVLLEKEEDEDFEIEVE